MKYGRSDLDRIGLFSEAAYISTGEAYRKNNGEQFKPINK